MVKLFVAGIVPGILGGLGRMALSYYLAIRKGWPVEDRFNLCRVWVTFKESAWALLLPLAILGGIFGGFVTATEGAGLAVVVALFVPGVIYRDLDLNRFYRAAVDGAVQTAVVMLLIATSALLGVYLTEQQVPQRVAETILGITAEPWRACPLLMLWTAPPPAHECHELTPGSKGPEWDGPAVLLPLRSSGGSNRESGASSSLG